MYIKKKEILLLCIVLGSINATLAGYVWTANNHLYDLAGTAASGEDARRACQNNYWDNNGNTYWGYLATITSKAEMDFLVDKNLVPNAWISGSDEKEQGIWIYNSGPESGEIMYDFYNEKCYTYCPLSTAFCFADGNGMIATSSGTITNKPSGYSYQYLCEYGALETDDVPRISPLTVPTEGGYVTISGLAAGYVINSVVVTVAATGFANYNTTCDSLSSTATECYIKPGNGGSITLTTIGNTATGTIKSAFEPPHVHAVYPSYTSGSIVTLVGSNFGSNPSLLSVTIGTANTACNTITMLEPHNIITCTLTANLGTNKFLPVTVTLNGQTRKFNQPAIYYSTYSMFFRVIAYPMISDYAFKRLEDKTQLFGQTGYHTSILSAAMQTFLTNTLPTLSTSYNIWQNYYAVDNHLALLVGPYLGATPNYYAANTVNTAASPWLRFLYTLSNGQVDDVGPDVEGYPIFRYDTGFMFIKNDRLFSNDISYECPTTGCAIQFHAKNYGLYSSSVLFNAMNVNTSSFQRDQNSFVVTVPPGFGTNRVLKAYVNSKESFNHLIYSYSAPTISNVVVNDGYMTITGNNFYTDASLLTVNVGASVCTSPSILTAHTSIRCLAPSDSTLSTRVTIAGNEGPIQSNLVTPSLSAPKVVSVSSASVFGGIITITGSNFFSTASAISVTVGGSPCTSVAILTANTQITCNAPSSVAGPKPVIVTVSTRVSNSDISVVYQAPVLTSVTETSSSSILISGNGFGTSASALTITIGSSTISSSLCVASGASITCSNLPTNLVNGLVSVSGSNQISIKFNPTVTSTTLSVDQTQVTIVGNHFDGVAPTFGGVPLTCGTQSYTQLICTFATDAVSGAVSITPTISTPNVVFSPFVTSVNPSGPIPTIGSTVIVQGGHFENHSGYTLSVLLQGTTPMTFTKLGLGFLSVQIPSGSGTGKYFVIKVNSITTSNVPFSYAAPSISSTKTSGSQLSIIGNNFGSSAGSATLTIGGSASTVSSITPTTIVATIPSNALQTSSIALSIDGQSTTFTQGITLHPSIVSVTPVNIVGGIVTITSNYAPPSDNPIFSFDPSTTIPSTSIVSTSPYQYTVNAPSGCTNRLVSLSLGSSSSFSAIGNINYLQPTIISVSRPIFFTPGLITITGTNFLGSGITNGYISQPLYDCRNVQIVSDTTITCLYESNAPVVYQDPNANLESANMTIYLAGACPIQATVFKYVQMYITSVEILDNGSQIFLYIKGENFKFNDPYIPITATVTAIGNPVVTNCQSELETLTKLMVTCTISFQPTHGKVRLDGGPNRAVYEF